MKRQFLFGRRLPTHLTLFVTSRCNAACLHCFVATNRSGVRELTLSEFEDRVSRPLGALSNLNISGGEPFLREDLPEICRVFDRNNRVASIFLPSNGLMPDRIAAMVERILRGCAARITFSLSLDGPQRLHDEIRQVPGAYRTALETYERMRQLKERFPSLSLNIGTAISRRNCAGIPELIQTVKDRMPEIDSHGFDWVRGVTRDPAIRVPEIGEIERLMPLLKETRRYYCDKRGGLLSRLELAARIEVCEIQYRTLKEKRQVIPCVAGSLFAVVDESGNVGVCELLPPIGNVRDEGMREILSSAGADRQRRAIRAGACHCVHGCVVPSNVIRNPFLYPRLLKRFIFRG